MRKSVRRKVVLSRETLCLLESREMLEAAGGELTLTCPGVTCKPTVRGITGCSVNLPC